MNVISHWIFFLFVLVISKVQGLGQQCQYPSNDACSNYQTLDEPHRSTKFSAGNGDRLLCDNGLPEGWYRFLENGRDVNMPTSCVDEDHCGTVDPIWMQGSLPTLNDGAVERVGCVNHGDMGIIVYGGTTCCHETIPICVKNCNGFYVYRLSRTSGCSEAYCAGGQDVCPLGKFGPNCIDMYPKMTNMPELQNPQCDNGVLKFPCRVHYDPKDTNAAFEVVWIVDGQPLHAPRSTKPIVETLTGGKREAYLDAFNLIGNMGKRLQCKVTSFFLNLNLTSDIQLSNEIYCGIITNPTNITASENGQAQQITLTTSLPHCAPMGSQPSCDFSVELKAMDNYSKDISTTNGCIFGFIFNPNTKQCVADISVLATRDFLNDGDHTHTLSFRPIRLQGHPNKQSQVWFNHTISPVQVTTKDAKSGICHLYQDPYVNTLPYGQTSINLQRPGHYVLYRVEDGCNNIKRPMEVHIQTQSCLIAATCICGVVARDGNDIIEVNGCTMRKNAFYVSVLQNISAATTLHTDASGKNYYINFQSGARLTITSDPSNKLLIDAQLEVPSDHAGCTKGLCGTFDDKLIDANGTIVSANGQGRMEFAYKWLIKPEDSMFNKRPQYNLLYNLKGNDYCQCINNMPTCSGANPQKNVFAGGTGIPISPKKVTQNGKRQLEHILSQGHTEVIRKRSTTWPTPSGLTQSQATYVCHQTMEKSPLFRYCGRTIHGYIGLLLGCLEDIQSSDSLDFIKGYTFVYTKACQYEVSVDVRNYIPGQDGQLVLPNYVTSDLCPQQCHFQGTCNKGQCHCDAGYQGPDCSVKTGTVPVIISIHGNEDIDSLCDLRKDQCTSVFVVADHLFYSPQLQCRLQYYSMSDGRFVKNGDPVTVGALFRTFNEIECPLPSSMLLNGNVAGQLKISVTTDGTHYSNESISTIYDSLCQNCSEQGVCSLKRNTCLIENHCRHKGEQNAKQEICEPTVNQYAWTNDITVKEIDHFTASLTGCECPDDPGTYTCACCQNEGCPCASTAPHQCVDCSKKTECGKNPEIYNV